MFTFKVLIIRRPHVSLNFRAGLKEPLLLLERLALNFGGGRFPSEIRGFRV